jgi:hemerythrin-like metal-binding protein
MNHKRIEWSKEFSIGNNKIDKDHIIIINLVNKLIDIIERGLGSTEFARILTEMIDYSLNHFKKEEAYMIKLGYPSLSQHQKAHRTYLYKATMFNVEFMEKNQIDPWKIVEFLINWWENHIQKVDADYEAFKKKTQSDAEYGLPF